MGVVVDDAGFKHLNGREKFAIAQHIDIHRNNIKRDRITIGIRIVPIRQIIKTVIDHTDGVL